MKTLEEVKAKIANENRRTAVELSLRYIAPRKRTSAWAKFHGMTFEESMANGKQWILEKGGRFISGHFGPCTLWDSDMGDGRIITMVSTYFCAQMVTVSEEQIALMN